MSSECLLLGVAKEDITPKVGGKLYGYQDNFFSTGIHDRLEAVAFVFRQNGTVAVIVSASVCLIKTDLSDRIRSVLSEKHGIPAGNIMISATHTHCGPNTSGSAGWGNIDCEYTEGIFIPRIVEAVGKALSNIEEVKMGIGIGNCFAGVNRRERKGGKIVLGQNECGPFNPKMTVISFRRFDGTVKANLIHYGAHGTCAGRDPNISRDWPGIMTDRVELISGAVTAFINGPEGDVGPRCSNGSTAPHGSGFVFVEEIGNAAAFDAVRIYKSIGGYHDCTLSCKEFEINLPLAPKEPKAEVEKRLATYNNRVNIVGLAAAYCEKVIDAYEKGIPDEEFFTVKQTVLKLGNLAIVSFPFELFSEIGIRIAKASRIPTVLSVACTNGSHGYFPTESEICLGGYEILYFKYSRIQQCKPFADNYLIEETLKNLEDD